MRMITYVFVAAGSALIVWALYQGLFVVQVWASTEAGEAQVAMALHALARPMLLCLAGAGMMLGGTATAVLARARQCADLASPRQARSSRPG
ncbi:hypothetical protein [Nonomuraea sp. NPDC050691]|uniref:hypothetical protein n=1 Tax=Nonomuraea sp. NPDC050691 TaxID=3155661 RepID=UPI0033C07EA2